MSSIVLNQEPELGQEPEPGQPNRRGSGARGVGSRQWGFPMESCVRRVGGSVQSTQRDCSAIRGCCVSDGWTIGMGMLDGVQPSHHPP